MAGSERRSPGRRSGFSAREQTYFPMTELRFETAHYLVRPLTKGDVSVAWGSWLLDPTTAQLLNTPSRKLSRRELEAYVEQFDNRDKIILGIFHRPSGTHIGIVTLIVSQGGHDVLANIIIGDDNFRSVGGMVELKAIRTAIHNDFLITKGFRSAFASVVAHNTRMIAYLKLSGWDLVRRTMSRPSATGEMVELLLFRLTQANYIRREGKSWTSPRSPELVIGGCAEYGARP